MKIFKFEFKLLVLSFISITFLLSCENDANDVGANLIPDKSQGDLAYVDLVAYNVSNSDTVRADYKTLTNGLVGIYEEPVFGKSKASFNMQVRLNATDAAVKGSIQVVDSVILTISPDYNTSGAKVTQTILNPGSSSGVDTIKYVTRYPIASYLGKSGASMGISVNRINTFLESSESVFYSNKTIDVGDLLGTAILSDTISKVEVKTSGGTVISEATTPGYRIKLDPAYFKQNFFDKKGSADVSDNSRFIQYFKGIRISPTDDVSKFMFNFPKNKITLTAYYKYKDSASDADYTSTSYSFAMNTAYNSAVGEYDFYGRSTASSQLKQQMASPNTASGESQLFLQGMGGPSIKLKLNDAQLEGVKDSIKNKGWAIIGAKLKFYLNGDPISKPSYIYGYNATQKAFLTDLTSYSSLSGYYFNPAYDFTVNPGYYTLNITQHIKNILEKNEANDEILVEMGDFLKDTSSTTTVKYLGYYRTTRAYDPSRLVFYGNNATEDKKLRLEITYTKN